MEVSSALAIPNQGNSSSPAVRPARAASSDAAVSLLPAFAEQLLSSLEPAQTGAQRSHLSGNGMKTRSKGAQDSSVGAGASSAAALSANAALPLTVPVVPTAALPIAVPTNLSAQNLQVAGALSSQSSPVAPLDASGSTDTQFADALGVAGAGIEESDQTAASVLPGLSDAAGLSPATASSTESSSGSAVPTIPLVATARSTDANSLTGTTVETAGVVAPSDLPNGFAARATSAVGANSFLATDAAAPAASTGTNSDAGSTSVAPPAPLDAPSEGSDSGSTA